MLYMVTFTINISPMLAYIPYMDPMGDVQAFLTHKKIGQANLAGQPSIQKMLQNDPRTLKPEVIQGTNFKGER